MGADGAVPGRLVDAQALLRLEPLPALVHQGHQRDGRAADPGRDPRDVVEGALGGRVQDVVPAERRHALRFIRGDRCSHVAEPFGQGPAEWDPVGPLTATVAPLA